jgi:hypothetical protein
LKKTSAQSTFARRKALLRLEPVSTRTRRSQAMPTVTPDRLADWRLWWFAKLESAIERGDNRAAREALRHLERLGIEVRFTLPPQVAAVRRD